MQAFLVAVLLVSVSVSNVVTQNFGPVPQRAVIPGAIQAEPINNEEEPRLLSINAPGPPHRPFKPSQPISFAPRNNNNDIQGPPTKPQQSSPEHHRLRLSSDERRHFREQQAKSAHYSFDSAISDSINDNTNTRQETRDGLSLSGMYSYSDGFFKRTVHYVADENGYRVTNTEVEPIGDGPQYNPNGQADVSSSLIGSYTVTEDDFKRDPKYNRPALKNNKGNF